MAQKEPSTTVQYSLSTFEEIKFAGEQAKNNYTKGRKLYEDNDFTQAVELFKKGAVLSEQANDVNGLILCHYWAARCYRRIADYSNYHKHLSLLEDLSLIHRNKKYLSYAYEGFGNLYRYLGDYPKSIENYMKAIDISDSLGNLSDMSTALNNMSLVYDYMGNNKEELKIQLRNYSILQKLDKKSEMVLCLSNLAGIYSSLAQREKAREYANKAIKIVEEVGEKNVGFKNLAAAYNQSSSIAISDTNFVLALDYTNKSFDLMKNHKDKKGMVECYGELANIYRMTGKDVLAEEFLLKQLAATKEIHYMNGHINACSALADLKTKQGDYKMANVYLKECTLLKDSLTSEAGSKKIAEASALFNFKYQQQLIKVLYDDKVARNHELEKRKILLYGGALGIVCILLFAFFGFRSYKQKRRA